MKITKFNYEVFALDYLEGNLPDDMVKEMESLMNTYPEIKEELTGLQGFPVAIADTSVIFEHKDELLKEEKVIFIQRKWYRALAIASGVLLILTAFVFGYKAGINDQSPAIVKHQEGENPVTPAEKEMEQIATNSTPAEVEEEVSNDKKVPQIMEEVTTSTIDKTATASNVDHSTKPITKEDVFIPPIIRKTDPIAKLKNTPSLVSSSENEKKEEPGTRKRLLTPEVAQIASMTPTGIQRTNNRGEQIVQIKLHVSNLESSKTALLAKEETQISKIRKLFGKFPGEGIKVSFIPSYFSDESQGQD